MKKFGIGVFILIYFFSVFGALAEEVPIEEPVERSVLDSETPALPIEPMADPAEVVVPDMSSDPITSVDPVAPALVDSEPPTITDPLEGLAPDPSGIPGAGSATAPAVQDATAPAAPPPESPATIPAAPESTMTYQLILNEVMLGSEVNPEKDAWIELYNPTDEEVLLFDWKIRGVTAGGAWIDLVTEPYRAIQPKSYFLISHYTNSRSSALAITPQVNKSSLIFSARPVMIELKDPQGQLSDRVRLDAPAEEEFRSYERKLSDSGAGSAYAKAPADRQSHGASDGFLPESFGRSTLQINLKPNLTKTFATPLSANSVEPAVGEVSDFLYELQNLRLTLRWQNPDDLRLERLNLYRLNPEAEEWWPATLFLSDSGAATVLVKTDGIVPHEWTLEPFSVSDGIVFKIKTVDFLGRESAGEELTVVLPSKIVISEILPKPKTRPSENEFIEIHNSGLQPVDLRGWELDNQNREDDFSYFFLDDGRDYTIPPDGFFVLYSNESMISLNDTGDSAYLSDPEGNEADHYDLAALPAGRSWARSSGDPELWITLNHPTPGGVNIEINRPPVPVIAEQGGTRYTKINLTGEGSYDPDGDAITFAWEFEPGAKDSRRNPTEYIYRESGLKIISLTLIDEFGLSSAATHSFDAVAETGGRLTPLPPDTVPFLRPYSPGDLMFLYAVPNPEGEDKGKESFTVRNNLNEPVNLSGWKIRDGNGKEYKIGRIIAGSGEREMIPCAEMGLSLKNKSGRLLLLSPNPTVVDEMSWEDADAGERIFGSRFIHDDLHAIVTEVTDGDTFRAMVSGEPVTVRLIGVDTPETVHPRKAVEKYGKEASGYLKKILDGQEVVLNFDEDKADAYNRLLAYVYLRGVPVNAEILRMGFGAAYTRFPFARLEEFSALELEAKNQKLGIWQESDIQKWMNEDPLRPPEPDKEEKKKEDEKKQKEEAKKPAPACPTEGLSIDSILPNPENGKSEEFIRLSNPTGSSICLSGWGLDDAIDGGSKPYVFTEGALEPGGKRDFPASVTGVRLNNGDDCANLISPAGAVADVICYQRTHKNELFTHAGGDWKPKRAAAKKTARTKTGRSGKKSVRKSLPPPSVKSPDGVPVSAGPEKTPSGAGQETPIFSFLEWLLKNILNPHP